MVIDEIWINILKNNFDEKFFFNIYDRNKGFFFFIEIKNNEVNVFFCCLF